MSRIVAVFDRNAKRGRTALVPYITAGDPQTGVTVPLMHAMVDAGADILELGVPFSDPMADGPVIQAACERALKHHMSLNDVLAMVREFRQRDDRTPVVLMGYLNPIEVMGYGTFAALAADAGVDGVLTVDLPPEESHDLLVELRDRRIDPIFLIAPTSDSGRISRICAAASGFVYYVSLKGVTGSSALDVSSVASRLEIVRKLSELPVGVGFGIKDPETAAQVARIADAVVVGSAIVNLVAANAGDAATIRERVGGLLSSMRAAMDANSPGEDAA
jgi:tryptophan synthase alpha chain